MARDTIAKKSEVCNKPSSNSEFQFISIQGPHDVKDRNAKRTARSHAVARGLQNKRNLQQKSGLNFQVDYAELRVKRIASPVLGVSQLLLSFEAPDAFQTLAAEAPRLQVLLDQLKTQIAAQPVFSILDELVFKSLHSVLRRALDDRAFLNAFMLTCTFAVTSNSIDKRYLLYQSQALSTIRRRMNVPDSATTESTIGAILLLAGIEVRREMPRQVQMHMGAIHELLAICKRQSVCLSDGIKRAIFWSDLNASVLTGSDRIVDHTTFSELHWHRDAFSPNLFLLPPGFRPHSYLLGEAFVEILKDISALQCIRDSYFLGTEDVMFMAQIDNHQASVQSRLVSLPHLCPATECCHLAAYLCSAMLRCKIWRTSTVPSHLSFQLLQRLQESNDDVIWDDRPDLLAWMLYMGGAFAPTGSIRSDYTSLLRSNQSTRLRGLYTSWPELLEILKQFIWSEKAFQSQVKEFWEALERDYVSIV